MNVDTSVFTDLSLYKKFIGGLDEDQIDSVGEDYTSCWLYALYIHTLLDLPMDDDQCDCIYERFLNNIYEIEEILEQNGIYSFYHTNKTEFHHFILIVTNDNLMLFSTYGGQKGIINKTFNKKEWTNNFLGLFGGTNTNADNKINSYKWLFGIDGKIESLDLTQCIFMYTKN